ncbi:MAG: serine/threonine protein kinase, partial [Myxococcales bacterium]|nr:serine/threonine protein kinase [Myxococcales bacterium]
MEAGRTFTIERCLGRGGFGEVYQARMVQSGGSERTVAVKVLRRDIDADGQAVRRLRDEGRLLARLDHPTILRVLDLVLLEERISLVTELVDGHDLSACLRPPDPMGPRALATALSQVASAIDAAWNSVPRGRLDPLRMVHRDIKPSNIRISRHGHVKLLDFGIARTDAVERESRTRTGMLVGSPAYMAPERFLEHGTLVASDVFAVGTVLFEGLVGERFYGTLPIPMQVGLAVSAERYAIHLAETLERVADPGMRDLLANVLAHDPEARMSPAELQRSLDTMADGLGGPSLDRWCRKRDWYDLPPIKGDMEGRTVTEGLLLPPPGPGSLSPSLVPTPKERPPEEPALPAPPVRPHSVETLERPARPPVPSVPSDAPVLTVGLLAGTGLLALGIALGSLGAGVGVGYATYGLAGEPAAAVVVPPVVP